MCSRNACWMTERLSPKGMKWWLCFWMSLPIFTLNLHFLMFLWEFSAKAIPGGKKKRERERDLIFLLTISQLNVLQMTTKLVMSHLFLCISFPSTIHNLYQLFPQNKSGENLLQKSSTSLAILKSAFPGQKWEGVLDPDLGPPSPWRNQKPAAAHPWVFCCLSVCCSPMVVGNCWIHCMHLVSQVYFLNQHKKKNDKGRRVEVFMLSAPANYLRPKTTVSADGRVRIMTRATMETQISCRASPAPSCRPLAFSVAATQQLARLGCPLEKEQRRTIPQQVLLDPKAGESYMEKAR